MNPELQIEQAQRRIHHAEMMSAEAARLSELAAQLMDVQRHWNEADRAARLSAALSSSRDVWTNIQTLLAAGTLTLPSDVQHNLLILSVYADSKTDHCASVPSINELGSLIALTRTLAGSLKEWREAA